MLGLNAEIITDIYRDLVLTGVLVTLVTIAIRAGRFIERVQGLHEQAMTAIRNVGDTLSEKLAHFEERNGDAHGRIEGRMDAHGEKLTKHDDELKNHGEKLARIEGLRIAEIAERMGRSRNAVAHLLSRALAKLKDTFGDTESFHLPACSLDEGHGRGEA